MNLPTWLIWSALAIASATALFTLIWKSDEDFYGIEEFKKFNEAMNRGKR